MTSEYPLIVTNCSDSDFELVKQYIKDFELDDRQLKQEEFLTLLKNGILLGFGRIREFNGFSELCSLGIITEQRAKGLGKILSKALIKKSQTPLYLVCIIPSYFEQFSFAVCDHYPSEMRDKLNYCTNNLCVDEKYLVMKNESSF